MTAPPNHRATVAELIHHSAMVAYFAARMGEDVAGQILTYVEEPELLCEPDEPPPRYHPAAISAARLICYDATAIYRDGKPRHFAPRSVKGSYHA